MCISPIIYYCGYTPKFFIEVYMISQPKWVFVAKIISFINSSWPQEWESISACLADARGDFFFVSGDDLQLRRFTVAAQKKFANMPYLVEDDLYVSLLTIESTFYSLCLSAINREGSPVHRLDLENFVNTLPQAYLQKSVPL